MSEETMKVSGYLEISNILTIGRTTMKPIQMLMYLIILQRIQAKLKKEKEQTNGNKIKISKKYLSCYFNTKILTPSYMKNLMKEMLDDHCIIINDETILDKFIIDVYYDNECLYVEYEPESIYSYLVLKDNFTQIDLQYACRKCVKSKNAIHLYILICRMKSLGVLKLKKETIINILGKDHVTNYPISKLTRDIKNALDLMKDLIGDYELNYNNNVYVIKFKKFKIKKVKNSEEFEYDKNVI